MNSAQEFIQLYNTLDNLLENKYRQNGRNKSYIMTYALELQKSAFAKTIERGRTLNLIRQLRNSLVHDFDMNKDGLIEITPKLLNFLQEEIEILSSPKRAIHICTKLDKLLYAKLEDRVNDLLVKMVHRGNLQVPILNENFELIGVFSPNVLIRYLTEKRDKNSSELSIIDLLEYLPIDKHISEYYRVYSKNDRADEIAEAFESYYHKGKKLVMVFVTSEGKLDEQLLGIITPYDVVNLEN